MPVADEGADAEAAAAEAEVRVGGVDDQVRPGGLGGPGGPGEPAGPGEPGEPGGPGARPPRNPNDLNYHGGSGNSGGPVIAREAVAAVCCVPQIEWAPGPGGDAVPAAGCPGNRQVQFNLSVPFPSSLAAEFASGFLTPYAEHEEPVQKEISVNGRILAVRLTAENPSHLHISVISCLDQLSMMMQILQPLVPAFFFKPHQGKEI